ncbi:MAG: hypothetical protein HYZ83_04350, partial [Candidatus Omnitrophica bacterium]|nr:hypothetical protein [Candidatus Omnitrophota bacterium]
MIAAAILGATAIFLIVYFSIEIFSPKGLIGKKKQIKERIYQNQPAFENHPVSVEKKTKFSDIQSFQKWLNDIESAQKLAIQLKRAGSQFSLSVFLLTHFALASVVFFIANLFLPHSSSVPLAALFIYFPFLYLKRKNNQYLALFSEYLADAT